MHENNLYDDPAFYDLMFPSGSDVVSMPSDARRARIVALEEFYLTEAVRARGRVLVEGCGTGRLPILLARKGIAVTGLDLSGPMLDAARSKAISAGVDVLFIQADMRRFELPGLFAAILIAGNALLHLLAAEDWKQCLSCIRRHLTPGGRLVFDVSKWDLELLVRDPGTGYPVITLQDPRRGKISIEETASYDAAKQVRHIVWYLSAFGAPDYRVIPYSLRVIFPHELMLLLEGSGLRCEARYGEFTRLPFESSSPRQVCVCIAEA